MENSNVNCGIDTTQNNQEQKTFTQEDVNRIVQERLARVKTQSEPDQKELELQQREANIYAHEQVIGKGLPSELAESLKGLDKATIDKCIEIVAPYAKKAAEPILNPVGRISGYDAAGDAIRQAMGLKR